MKFEKLKLTAEYICKIDNDNNREAKHAFYLMVGGSIIHALVGVAIIMCYFLNLGKSNTGINAKGKVIVCATGFIRVFGYTSGLLVTYVFCKNKIINFIYTKLIKTLIFYIIIYVPWSIYCVFRFFSPENDTKETAGFLYSGMFYLMIEGIILKLAIALLLIFVSTLLVLILYLSRVHNAIKHEDYIRNLKLHKLTQRKYDCTETCHICAEKYTLEDRVKSLECHEVHYFHKDCLKEWIKAKSTCPICNEEVGDVDIEYTDNPDDSYHHSERTIRYGSMDVKLEPKLSLILKRMRF